MVQAVSSGNQIMRESIGNCGMVIKIVFWIRWRLTVNTHSK